MKSVERLGAWIADNPTIIIALAVLQIMASINYAVGKDSPIYQIYDYLFVEI